MVDINNYNYNDMANVVREREKGLKKIDQVLLEQRTAEESKSLTVTWVIWLAFGSFGGHRLYLRKKGSGIAMMALTIIGILLAILIIGLPLLLITFIWRIVDACLLNRWVKINRLKTKLNILKRNFNINIQGLD